MADELGIKFMETSAKVNEGVEEAFFTLARCAVLLVFSFPSLYPLFSVPTESDAVFLCSCRDIKTRLIDSQGDAAGGATNTPNDGSVRVTQQPTSVTTGCCS